MEAFLATQLVDEARHAVFFDRFGAEVMAGTLRAGEVLSGRTGRAMALLRLDRIQDATLTSDGRPVTVQHPSWVTAPPTR